MLLGNIDKVNGLCNDIWLQVNDKNIISVTVIIGKNIGEKIFIPTINLIPFDSRLPFKF